VTAPTPGPAPASPAGTIEETGYVPSGAGWIYGFVSRPAGGASAGVVLLGPFAEEKKSSLRPLAEIARALARAGFAALRVDFRGTGDSSGRSAELSLGSMVDDTCAAAGALRGEFGCGRVALAGLRLGASVALLAAGRSRPEALALVEPVVDGRSYLRELERAVAIRRMLTRGAPPDGRAVSAVTGEMRPAFIDLDGMELARGFLDEIGGIDLVRAARELAQADGLARMPSLVLQLGARGRLREEYARLTEALGGDAVAQVVVAEPFWFQADYVDPAPASCRLVEFLAHALADNSGTEGRIARTSPPGSTDGGTVRGAQP